MTSVRRRMLLGLAASALSLPLLLGTTNSYAQDNYPNKPIHLIIPYPAGGGTDIIGRALSEHLSKEYKVPVVVENKPGASGIIGNDIVAKAKPDGYTLLVAITALIQTPPLYNNIPYKIEDLAPISLLALSSDFFMVHKDIPANTLDEFIELARKNPERYNYGNYGNGTSSHMHGELLKLNNNVDLVGVPFQGAAPLVNAILGGQITAAFVDASSANAHINSDRIKILAITGKQRHPAKPDVPTMGELGQPGFEANGWFATFAPANTPAPILNKLSASIQNFVASEEFKNRLLSMGLQPKGSTPEELSAVIERDTPGWADIIERANITLN